MTIRARPPLRPRPRDAVIRQWLLEQERKGNLTVGADVPLHVNAVISHEGQDIVVKCCVVGGGNFYPLVVRINIPMMLAMIKKTGVDTVGKFPGSLIHAITHNAVAKAIGNVAQKVASSPIMQIALPIPTLTAQLIATATGHKGAGGLAGKIMDTVNAGTAAVVTPYVGAQALGALNTATSAVLASQTAKTIAETARKAQDVINQGKRAATQVLQAKKQAEALLAQGKTAAATAVAAKQSGLLALVKKAVKVRTTVTALAPALTIKAADSRKVQAAIANIAAHAKTGNPLAKQAAVSIVAAAKMTDKISAAKQAAVGGHAGFVVSANGSIRRAPKGKFIQTKALPMIETLYRGAKDPPLRGSFTAVSGQPNIIRAAIRKINRDGMFTDGAAVDLLESAGLLTASGRPTAAGLHAGIDPRGTKVAGRHSLDIGPAWGALFSGSPGSIEHTPQWGGARDPGDEYDGPIYPARYNDPGAWPTYMADPAHTPNPVITPPIPEPGFPPLPPVVSGWTKVGAYDSGATHTRTEVRSPTRTSTEVRSPTRTATEVRSPTSTSTDAYTQGNFTATVTGGAGAGATHVHIYAAPQPYTLDSRGPKQLARTSMDVDTSSPASDSAVGNTRNFLGMVAGDAHGWGLGPVVSGPGHWPLPGGDAAARKKVAALLAIARAKHHAAQARKRSKVGHMASLMVGRSSINVGEDLPPELTESSDGLPDVDMIVQGLGLGDADLLVQGLSMHDTDMIVQGVSGVGCGDGVSGFPSYLFTRAHLSNPAIRRRFVAYMRSLPPKQRRRVGKRLRAAMYRTRVAGAIRGGYPAVGSHLGWTGVMGGIPGGYELVGSHREPGILTP